MSLFKIKINVIFRKYSSTVSSCKGLILNCICKYFLALGTGTP